MTENQDLSAFPYKPYSNQTDFIQALNRSLMFENNTWTGESLSIIFSALQWLIDHKEKIKAKERVSQVFSDAGEDSLKTHMAGSKDQVFLLQDYKSQEESSLVRRKSKRKSMGGYENSEDEEECSDYKQGLKVLFRCPTDWSTGIISINERFLRAKPPDTWLQMVHILQSTRSRQSKCFALLVVQDVMKDMWNALTIKQRNGMKNYISQIFVKIVKQEWPTKWRNSIPHLVKAAKTGETIFENCMSILNLLYAEVFDFSRGEMTHSATFSAKTRGRLLPWLPSSESDRNTLNSQEYSSETQSDDSDDDVAGSDDDDDVEKIWIHYPKRSDILKRLPPELLSTLKENGSVAISDTVAQMVLKLRRFLHVSETEPEPESLGLCDSEGHLHIYWKPLLQLVAWGLVTQADFDMMIHTAGPVRDQQRHLLCWAYVVCDLISASRVLHGWDEEFTPLCPWFLFQHIDSNKNTENLESEKAVGDDGHKCFGYSVLAGLAYAQRYGIPRERPGKEEFDCHDRRTVSDDEELIKISGIFHYSTLEKALIRLQTHHVGATLTLFKGYDKRKLFESPLTGGTEFCITTHAVMMVHCQVIKGKRIVWCKSSNGEKYFGYDGYIGVCIDIMLIGAGIRRGKKNVGKRKCREKPQYLLSNFFSVDMDYKDGEIHGTQEQRDNNESSRLVIGPDDFPRLHPPRPAQHPPPT